MSKSHPYRVQVHCDKQLHTKIVKYAEDRGISQSAAGRILIEQALANESTKINDRIDNLVEAYNKITYMCSHSLVLNMHANTICDHPMSNKEVILRGCERTSDYMNFLIKREAEHKD